MAINTNATQNPVSATAAPKKKGSGFVSFDKAADQNKTASQAIGSQIQSNIGQQVQSVQGQLQNEQNAVKSQLDSEANRLAGSIGVAQGIQADPTQVNKSTYQDLISGSAKQADTKAVQGLQGSLGTTAQVAQQFSSNPAARQQAIQQTTNRPRAMQNLMGVQANLDSMLLGRNVNTQDLANKTARSAFDVDRLVGSVVKSAGETGQELQKQAQDTRNVLRAARTTGIEGTEKAGAKQATTENEALADYRKYLGSDFVSSLINGGQGLAEGEQAKYDRALTDLRAAGFDPYTADVADLGGAEGAKARILSSMGTNLYDSQTALTGQQRNNLKSLYGLEDETYSPVLDADKANISGYNQDALKTIAEISAASKIKTQNLAKEANFTDAATQVANQLQALIPRATGEQANYAAMNTASNLYRFLTGNAVNSTTELETALTNPNLISDLMAKINSGQLEREAAYSAATQTGAAGQTESPWLHNDQTVSGVLGQDRLSTIQNYLKRLNTAVLVDPKKAPLKVT